jgi:hypothetical protein|tara:strand:- start:4442 stop:4684 length:243 start_codon:yes stop_codon:yes gene_type:complete
MINQNGNIKDWFNFGFENVLGARAETLTMEDVGVSLHSITIDLLPLSLNITQQSGEQVTFSFDILIAKVSFTISLGRLFL